MTTATTPDSPRTSSGWQTLGGRPSTELIPVPGQEPAPLVEQPVTEKQPRDLSHTWVVAAEVEVSTRTAGTADLRGSFKAVDGQRIDALEVYCKGCRRPYDEIKGEDCAEKIDNRHLIGGDQTTRAKRKIPTPPPSARIIPGGTIQRRGIARIYRRRLPPPAESASVKLNWAPGWGRSLRTISRIPVGQPARTSPPISATQAPWRTSPSGSTADVQADAGTARTAWWRASVRVMPTEYDNQRLRLASQSTNSWVPPPESVRISVCRPRR